MQVGDLVEMTATDAPISHGMIGLLLRKHYMPHQDNVLWGVLWQNGTKSNRWIDDLKVIK